MLGVFQVLKAASIKVAVFWDVATCSLVEVELKGAYSLRQRSQWPRGLA
jgi:hypothetical protein